MKSLAQLVDEAHKDLNIQRILAKPAINGIDEIGWITCKDFVNNLPVNYTELLTNQIKENPLSIKKYKSGDYICISFYKQFNPKTKTFRNGEKQKSEYSILFDFVQDENGLPKKISYVSFNEEKQSAYTRDIVRWQK